MGGDTGGNDCVHVTDVRAQHGGVLALPVWTTHMPAVLRDDTDVVIQDEHGNVCQFTYQEWWDFAEKVADWQYAEIGKDAREAMAPVDRCTCHETGSPCVCTGMDPSAMARLDALPEASAEFSGTFDAAELGEKAVALGTFTLACDPTPEDRRMINDAIASGEEVTLTLEDGAGILDLPVRIGRSDLSDRPVLGQACRFCADDGVCERGCVA